MSTTLPAVEADLSLPAGFERARGLMPEMGIRSVAGSRRRVLHGQMVPFNVWTEVNSAIEGHFMESFAPGSLAKTFAEGMGRIRCIFNHGLGGGTGKMVIGRVLDLHEDDDAAYYEVELFPSLEKEAPLLLEGIEAGEYGCSLHYVLQKADQNFRPKRSDHNAEGIPELRILEAKVIEFGPTAFGIYPEATSGLRSLTDDVMLERLAGEPEKVKRLIERSDLTFVAAEDRAKPLTVTPIVEPTTAPNNAGSGSVSVTIAGDTTNFTRTTEARKLERSYKRAAEFVGSSVWAMMPGPLAVVLQILGERVQGHRPSADEIAERIGGRKRAADAPAAAESPVRVIDISGPIVPHAGVIDQTSSELVSAEGIQAELRDAMASEDVKAILLNIDSPGGSAFGIPELAAEIRDARKSKPIVALANMIAGSAAYFIASAASEIVVSPSGEVGSIGVYAAHQDISELEAQAGRKTTLVSAGEYKVEGNPFEPLTEEARAEIQRMVDAHYQMFVKAVAQGRGTTTKTVEADFGQGRMVMAEDAVDRGMADRVATFSQTLAQLEKTAAKATTSSTRAAALPGDEPEPSEATTRERSDATEPQEPQHSTVPDLFAARKEQPRWQL